MLRVAAWTGGLFAVGAGVAHYFPGSWTEPLVLAALGATMLLLGSREGTRRDAGTRTAAAADDAQVRQVPVRPPAPAPAQRAVR